MKCSRVRFVEDSPKKKNTMRQISELPKLYSKVLEDRAKIKWSKIYLSVSVRCSPTSGSSDCQDGKYATIFCKAFFLQE